jgi:peptidoglycan hydrolase-like protein with peptidoglycan-binding domain
MYEGEPRSRAEIEYRRRRSQSSIMRRPDRIALWAVAMAVIAMVAAATSAHAGSGGTSGRGGTAASGRCPDARFGARALRVGDCGDDVKTLHWIMKADSFRVPMDKKFDGHTASSVRRFQRHHRLKTNGVVGRATRRKIAHSMPSSVATWYGPGFFGKRTACGHRLGRSTIGVAHRTLPCGTRVTLKYRGRYLRARVIDRGPYTRGVRWDLTRKTARKLHMSTTSTIRAAPVR